MPERSGTFGCLFLNRFNERLLRNLVFTDRTSRRFHQNVVRRRPAPARYLVEKPVKRNVGILFVTVFATADQFLRSPDHVGSTGTNAILGRASKSSPSKPLCNVHSSVFSS